MQKSKYKIGMVWAIIAFVFVLVSGALFFVAPMVDTAMGLNELVGVGYEPLTLLVGGINNLVSFNFAQPGYLYLFILSDLFLALLIWWGIMIAVKKVYKRYIALAFILVAGVLSLFIASSYIVTPCNPATLLGGEVLTRYVYKDLLNDYATMRVQDGVSAPFVFNNVIPMIMGYGVAIFGFAAFFIALFKPLFSAIGLCRPSKEERALRKAEQERLAEERRQMIAEIEEKRHAKLIAYVDYESSKPFREEEYERICAEAGIKPEPNRAQTRYNEVVNLPFFKDKNFKYKAKEEEPAKAAHSDKYYEETAKELGALGGDSYYKETARDLAILRGERNDFAETPHEVEPEQVSDDEYYAKLAKELPILQKQNLKKPESKEDSYDRLCKELLALRVVQDVDKEQKIEEAIKVVKQRALEGDAYYKRLEKELACLQYQKPPVTPDVE